MNQIKLKTIMHQIMETVWNKLLFFYFFFNCNFFVQGILLIKNLILLMKKKMHKNIKDKSKEKISLKNIFMKKKTCEKHIIYYSSEIKGVILLIDQ